MIGAFNLLAEQGKTGLVGRATPLATQLRFRIPAGLFVCVFLPGFLKFTSLSAPFAPDTVRYAMAGGAIAFSCAFYLHRQMGVFPGVRASAHVLFSVTLPFAVMAAIFLLTRLEYSRFVLAVSCSLSLAWLLAMHYLTREQAIPTIAVVPGGHAERLAAIPGARWRRLSEPPNSTSGVQAVAADLRHDLSERWAAFLANCALSGVPVYHSKQITESLTGKVEIEHLSENQFGSLLPNSAYIKVKFLVDWLAAFIVLLPFVVLFAFVAPLIVATSGWPVFYTQERVGYRGRKFKVFKFRTMAIQKKRKMTGQSPDGSGDCARMAAITGAQDRRITKIGAYLRKYRIDEIPQIFNILKGEMSWIGPRPEAAVLSHWYEEELAFYPYRHVVRPGISGWAQVNQGHVSEPVQVMEKLHYDFFYIKYLSPWLDLVIMLRTVRAVLTGFGAK